MGSVRSQAAPPSHRKRHVRFSDGTVAVLLDSAPSVPAAVIAEALRIEPPMPVLVLAGEAGLDPRTVARMHWAGRQVADAAVKASAAIVDGGIPGGLPSAVSRRLAERHASPIRVGVMSAAVAHPHALAPEQWQEFEPRHTHFVVAGADAPSAVADGLAEELAGRHSGVLVLAGGGPDAMDLVLRCVRRGWPIMALQGTGGLADELASGAEIRRGDGEAITEPAMAEIFTQADLRVFAPDQGDELERALIERLQPGEPTLTSAWKQFALYDSNAQRLRRSFQWLQIAILAVGIVGTVLALTQTELIGHGKVHRSAGIGKVLHYSIVVAPIALAVLLGAAAKFRSGNRWVVLRGAAEAVKREIYRYRTKTGPYEERKDRRPREQVLADQLTTISNSLMRTDVNLTVLKPVPRPPGPPSSMLGATSGDDGFSDLSAEGYLERRVGDQLEYYQTKSRQLAGKLRLLLWLIFIIGGVGTLLAALGVELWIALTTTLVAAITTYLGYEQVESTLANYNQAIAALTSLQARWEAVPQGKRRASKGQLVEQGEKILQKEQTSWIQDMTDALEELGTEEDSDESEVPKKGQPA